LRHGQNASTAELWRTTLHPEKSEAVLPGISMLCFDVSPDGSKVVYAAPGAQGKTQVFIAPLDRSAAPITVGGTGGNWPHFDAKGQILFQQTEGNLNYLERMNVNGSGRSKVVSYPIIDIQGVSPGRRWVMAMVPDSPGTGGPAPTAIPVDGGPPRRMCVNYCIPAWSPSGRFLFIPVDPATLTSAGRSLAIPVGPDETLPDLPSAGIPLFAQPGIVKGSQTVPRETVVPGKDPTHYAFVKTTTHRNLYSISLP
jgi:hypothetical protein